MQVWIKISTDNAAFEDNLQGETSLILLGLAKTVGEAQFFSPGVEIPLRDFNGNEVGWLHVNDQSKHLELD